LFSIVVIYNDKEVFENVLLKSLKSQSVKYELIAINNTEGKYTSAAKALNYGGKQATGKYIMFVHQDVELDTSTWLEDVEYILNAIPDIGIAGAVGMSENGKNNRERGRGFIDNSGEIWLWSNQIPKHEMYGLTSQTIRSAVSTPLNIAEGTARNSRKEFLQC
jgi:hypothetical protein